MEKKINAEWASAKKTRRRSDLRPSKKEKGDIEKMEEKDFMQEVRDMLEVFMEPTNKIDYIHAGNVWEILRLGCRDMIFSMRKSMEEQAANKEFIEWAEKQIAMLYERIDRINKIHFEE